MYFLHFFTVLEIYIFIYFFIHNLSYRPIKKNVLHNSGCFVTLFSHKLNLKTAIFGRNSSDKYLLTTVL
jgi:hypothetical protein